MYRVGRIYYVTFSSVHIFFSLYDFKFFADFVYNEPWKWSKGTPKRVGKLNKMMNSELFSVESVRKNFRSVERSLQKLVSCKYAVTCNKECLKKLTHKNKVFIINPLYTILDFYF